MRTPPLRTLRLRRVLAAVLAAPLVAGSLAVASPSSSTAVAPATPARAEAGGPRTLFGFTPGADRLGSRAGMREDYDRISRQLGSPQMYRAFFSGLPKVFPGSIADFGPPVSVSFKAAPQDIVAGKHDALLRSWFASMPSDRTVWWTYFHEPEDNIKNGEFTAAQYRAAWNHLLALAPKRANLRSTIILMQYSLTAYARRNVDDYVVPGADVLAWDAYLTPDVRTTADALVKAARTSRSYGMGFAVAEVSVTADRTKGLDRSAVMHQFVTELVPMSRRENAEFVAWFEVNKDDGDWRLAPYDRAASTWRQLTTGGSSTPSSPSSPSTPARRDSDGDRLSDAEERRRGTNPHRRHSDRDGLPDGREVRNLKTDPRRADTDRDGLGDGREVRNLKTSPRRADTDRDGLRDGREVRRTKTNPRRADTDRDCVRDAVELRRGTNPRVAQGGRRC